mmetsp:Transcript_11488/g.28966  ORF Transcript_11488/g.28966 Transcript_11488/m.28966 type:complete len:641 (-) Transcript_11488:46-1968(-)
MDLLESICARPSPGMLALGIPVLGVAAWGVATFAAWGGSGFAATGAGLAAGAALGAAAGAAAAAGLVGAAAAAGLAPGAAVGLAATLAAAGLNTMGAGFLPSEAVGGGIGAFTRFSASGFAAGLGCAAALTGAADATDAAGVAVAGGLSSSAEALAAPKTMGARARFLPPLSSPPPLPPPPPAPSAPPSSRRFSGSSPIFLARSAAARPNSLGCLGAAASGAASPAGAAAAAAAAIGRARAPVGEVQVHTLVLGHGLHKAGASVVKALEGVPALGAQVLARLREVAGGAFQLPAQLAALQRLRAAGGHVGGGGDGGAGDAGEAREAARKELRHIVHLGLGLGRHGGRAKAHVLAALAGGDVVPLVGVLRNLPGEKVLLLGSGRLQLRPGVLALPPKPGAVAHAARLGAALLHRAAIAPVVPVVAAEAGQAAVARRHGLAARLGRGRPAGGGLGGRRRVVHPAARLGAQLLPVKLGSLGVVLVRDLRLLGQAVLAEKVVHALVAAELHLLQLVRVPGVHANRPDKADVHAEAAVLAAALQAHEGAIADGRPLGVLGGAVHAHLVVGAFLNLTQDSQRFGGRHGAPVMRRENRRAARFEYQAPLLGDSEREPKGWTTCEARCAGWEVLLRAQGVGAIKSQET